MDAQAATVSGPNRMAILLAASAQADSTPPDAETAPSRWQPLAQKAPRRRKRRWLGLVIALGLLGLVAAALAFWRLPWPMHASLLTVDQGRVEIRDQATAPWQLTGQGETIGRGASLRSAPDTLATITLFDRGLMRIESSGEWTINTLQRSRGGHISRILVAQHDGRASYSAAMAGEGVSAVFQLEVPGATLDIVGVAIVTTRDNASEAQILQGRALIISPDEYAVVTSGQTALIQPSRPIAILEAPPSR
jgi:hypothetical protein